MPFLIGTDEAGYGPNLGPLVISTTVWRVDSRGGDASLAALDLYQLLSSVVTAASPHGVASSNSGMQQEPGPLSIADSKVLYKAGASLASLEHGVLAMLGLVGRVPRNWGRLFEMLLEREALNELCCLPWHHEFDLQLPVAADASAVAATLASLRQGLSTADVQLVSIESEVVFPERFNRLVAEQGSKGEVLSRLTLELVGRVLPVCVNEPVFVLCDKHGGRNRYGALLQRQFPDPLVEVHGESTPLSVYRWNDGGRRLEFRFQARGESWLPAAAASMVSKYLRELAMLAFNDFWRLRVPELRPTAGYPGDARRFKNAIAETQSALGIADHLVWRER
jgi:hypothetical protein